MLAIVPRHEPASTAPRTTGARKSPSPASNAVDVLTVSPRRFADLVAYCCLYEFQDLILELTGGDRVEPDNHAALEFSRRTYKYIRRVTRSRRIAQAMAVRPPTVQLRRDYDLFLPAFNDPWELYALASIPNWRKRCKFAACFVVEAWIHELPGYLLELLSEFDHIFLGVHDPAPHIARIAGRPCTYLPLAANVLNFAPLPNPPPRVIDVCNIGRRSPATHDALLRLERERQLFYYYDTVTASGVDQRQRTFHVESASEHRLLLANLLRRSRYYVANRSRVNEPTYTMGHDEISARFYEGAAAGAVLIGEVPRTEEFKRQFDWPDAVIHLPFDSPTPERLLRELDSDPQRLSRIRRTNVYNAALRHDWVYRLRTIFATAGLEPTGAMIEREAQLKALAEQAQNATL